MFSLTQLHVTVIPASKPTTPELLVSEAPTSLSIWLLKPNALELDGSPYKPNPLELLASEAGASDFTKMKPEPESQLHMTGYQQ